MQGLRRSNALIGFALAFSLLACVTPKGIDTASRIRECRVLDEKVTNDGAAAAFAAVLSGGSGLAAALPEKDAARNLAGLVSITTGGLSALTHYLSARNTDRFSARGC